MPALRQTILLAAIFAGLVPVAAAMAAGDVLLPPDNGGKSSLPNLGLMPAEPEAAPAAAPQKKPAQAAMPEKPAAAALLPVTQPAAPPGRPVPPPPDYRPAPLPYSIMVSLAKSTIWSANDLETVSRQTGLPKSGVVDHCRMGINGMLITNNGAHAVDSHATDSADVAYAGTVTNAMLSVYAACDSAPKPAPYNFIQRLGDRYAVALGSAFCAPKTPFSGTLGHITVTHGTNGDDRCVYLP
jgi:hypothetical protein